MDDFVISCTVVCFFIFMVAKSFFSERTLCVKPRVAVNGEMGPPTTMHLHILSL